MLSQRGTVQTDARTNTLIINDLPDRLTRADDLLTTLDVPQPQVEIEARIVQTDARLRAQPRRAVGRQRPRDAHSAIPLPWRSRITAAITRPHRQRQGDADSLTRTSSTSASPAARARVGLALGSVNGALNLDVALSALERQGQGRLLSTPRVSTQNNVAAEITQGVQIPIQTVANNTVTVTFKDAALTLKVTPQITAANTVIMRDHRRERRRRTSAVPINDIPPIDTQRAVTQVLVSDGETTVIGGIYVSREQASQDRRRALHRLPLLGWLFKRDSLADESRELLIFITPRIQRL